MDLKKAIETLKEGIKGDLDYKNWLMANIAYCVKEEFMQNYSNSDNADCIFKTIHKTSNDAANRFLDKLCGEDFIFNRVEFDDNSEREQE